MRTGIAVLLLICAFALPVTAAVGQVTSLSDESPTIIKQPNGPFVVIFFNNYAHGYYIGVTWLDMMRGPGHGKGVWRMVDRFWQEAEWASDVTSFAWSADSRYLYVATHGVYGNGGLYRLDLYARQARLIYPSAEEMQKRLAPTRQLFIEEIDANHMTILEIIDRERYTRTVDI
jgi:hypothetical protein